MNYYAVLDTNVVVSAMLKSSSVPGTVLELALDGNIVPVFNDVILQEYREVLCRPKFHLTESIVDMLLQALIQRGISIDAEKLDASEFPDPDDVVFYEVVMEERKAEDAYLVTGNLKHFPVKPFIVTPKQLLDRILSDQNDN